MESQHRPWRQVPRPIEMNSGIIEGGNRAVRRKGKVNVGIYNWFSFGLLLCVSVDGVSAQLQQKYCSSQNTGADHFVKSMLTQR